jgi:hypothetical protein
MIAIWKIAGERQRQTARRARRSLVAIEAVGLFRLDVDLTESYTRSIEFFLEGLKNRKR